MTFAIYPGTFDPITNGHLDILQRATKMFDRVTIAVADENYKTNLFTLEEREEMISQVISDTGGMGDVKVEHFKALLMDFVLDKGAVAIVRGLRAVSDFEYEFQLAMMNKKLSDRVEAVFLMTSNEYAFLSSTMIKQVASLGGCITGLVPPIVEEALHKKFIR